MNDRVAIAIQEHSNGKQTVAENIAGCSKFIICELVENKSLVKTEVYFNPLVDEPNCAYQLTDYLKQFNVNAIIAGKMGQKAVNKFLKYNINVFTAPGLTYKEAFDLYLNDKLKGHKASSNQREHIHN